jgi:hypothetical protein
MNVENTQERDPMLHLLGAMSDGPSNYITDMEAAGQQQLVNSDQLPTEAPWAALEKLGFKRGKPVEGDPLFTHCDLPEGWRRQGTDHAMHSNVIDERGVERVGVFYKAAFYDRRADAHLINVYGDGPVKLPDVWPVLTDEERADFAQGLENQLESAYGDEYKLRAQEGLELLNDRVQ